MAESLVIVGAGQAGGQLAIGLAQKGYEGRVTMIGNEDFPPYQRPPLSKAFLKGGAQERLFIRKPDYYEQHGIAAKLGTGVTRVDLESKALVLESGETLTWDKLVFATGARVVDPPIPGLNADGVHVLRTLADAQRIRAEMPGFSRVVVIGGGFIGLEYASVARQQGCDVTVIESQGRVMERAVSRITSELFESHHEGAGMQLLRQTRVDSVVVDDGGKAVGVRLQDGSVVHADAVLVAAGVVPNSELALAAGLAIDNGIRVDARLQTQDPDVYAMGDCASFPDPRTGHRIRLESVQAASDHARCICDGLTGAPKDYAAFPWFWSDQGDWKLQIAGLASPTDGARLVLRDGSKCVVMRHDDDHITALETINAPEWHIKARKWLGSGPVSRADASDLGIAVDGL